MGKGKHARTKQRAPERKAKLEKAKLEAEQAKLEVAEQAKREAVEKAKPIEDTPKLKDKNLAEEYDKISHKCVETLNPDKGIAPMEDVEYVHNSLLELHNGDKKKSMEGLIGLFKDDKMEETMEKYSSYLKEKSRKDSSTKVSKIIENKEILMKFNPELIGIISNELLAHSENSECITGTEHRDLAKKFNFELLKNKERANKDLLISTLFGDLVDEIERKKKNNKNKKKKMRKMKNKEKLKLAEDERKMKLHEKVQRRKQSKA